MKLVDPKKAWFVCRSNVRQEERAAESIRLAGFDVYLPRMKLETKDRRTKAFRETVKPLMTGYLFVGFTSFARHFEMVRKCDGVYDFVKVMGEPIPVPAASVIDIQCAEMDMRFDNTRAARIHRGEEMKSRKLNIRKQFQKGAAIVVTDEAHPFAHFQAVVDEVTSSGSVKALIDLFGRATSVEFQAGQLKPAA